MLAGDAASRWITTAAQMGMGFILPFALTFVAIPLETFIHASRTVLGTLVVGLLYAMAGLLRVAGNGSRNVGQALLNLYDLLIFAPLWVEQRLVMRGQRPQPDRTTESPPEKTIVQHGKPTSENLSLDGTALGVS
jgi:hypothetical protein